MNERPYTLTDDEANLIKDVLKALDKPGTHRSIVLNIARARGLRNAKTLDDLLDSAFIKLGNGRVTFIEDAHDAGRLPTIEELKHTAMDGTRLT